MVARPTGPQALANDLFRRVVGRRTLHNVKRRIAVSVPVHAPGGVVAGVPAADPCAAFVPHTPGLARRQAELASSLRVDLPAGASAVERVELTLGGRRPIEGDSFSFPIQWHAVGPRALFDAVLGHRLARSSLLSFLADAARWLDAEAERRPRRLGA